MRQLLIQRDAGVGIQALLAVGLFACVGVQSFDDFVAGSGVVHEAMHRNDVVVRVAELDDPVVR